MAHHYAAGDRVWMPDNADAWIVGSVISHDNNKIEIRSDKGVRAIAAKHPDYSRIEPCGSHIDNNIENLVDLDELSEGAILHHVRKRFLTKNIYTNVGAILVAVNPFEKLPIYEAADIKRCSDLASPKPHVFVTGAMAYQQLHVNRKNQSVLISGESGAGKTETTKKVLNYLSSVAPSSKPRQAGDKSIEEKILQSNPLLEAMGNAKTLRNNNSSRFGKWMKVNFDHSLRIQGCEIVNYLLEKSRVVSQSTMERNYHIFYQLVAGADATLRSRLHLGSMESYHYLNQSGCTQIDGVDDVAEYTDVMQALATLQFTEQTIDAMFRIIAGILHLGNVTFDAADSKDTEASKVSTAGAKHLQVAAEVFGVSPDILRLSLISKVVQMGSRGSMVKMVLNRAQAAETRDAVCKALYGNLFDWTIRAVNVTLRTESSPLFIGILDIFGFEIFEMNSFEQLCINYANEKLQYHFNEVIFSGEMSMYEDEGVPTDKIQFEDNGECVMLIEGKPVGLLSLLEEECNLGNNASDMTYIAKIDKTFGEKGKNFNAYFSKPKTKPTAFTVRHFAGVVEYNIGSWLDKNRDTLSLSCRECLLTSSVPLIVDIFQDPPEEGAAGADAGAAAGGKKGAKSGSTKSTLGGQFRNQLIGLVKNLRDTEPHFIRCVKPNHEKVPSVFTGELALRQLRYAGLFEAIRIRKSGFAYRVTHEVFSNTYAILCEDILPLRRAKSIAAKDQCERILKYLVIQKKFPPPAGVWQVAKTRVFIKTNQLRTILDRLKAEAVVGFAIKMQSVARGFIARVRTFAVRYALEKAKRKAEEYAKKRMSSIICIQKYVRRYLVKKMIKSMRNLIELRKALAMRDARKVQEIIERIEATGMDEDDDIAIMFKKEVTLARAMLRLIKLQDVFADQVEEAIRDSDVVRLNQYLVKAERMEMTAHPVIFAAKQELSRLHRKRRVMKTMVEFLHNEDGNTVDDRVAEMIIEARSLGVDADFVGKVQRVYDAAGPRLRVRNRLRRGIETVDKYSIVHALADAMKLRDNNPGFAELEIRAANVMLQLLEFDRMLHPGAWAKRKPAAQSHPAVDTNDEDNNAQDSEFGFGAKLSEQTASEIDGVEDDGPRISAELLVLCDRICSATDIAAQSKLKVLLRDTTVTPEQLEVVIRSYKWSKSLCVWKYPEVLDAQRIKLPPETTTPTQGSKSATKSSPSSGLSESKRPSMSVDVTKSAPSPAQTDNIKESPASRSRTQSLSRLSMSLLGGKDLFDPEYVPLTPTFGKATESDAKRLSPQDTDLEDFPSSELDFFGIRFSSVRSNVHIIRQLHKDIDSRNGEAPASLQAALAAVDLPPVIADSMTKLDAELQASKIATRREEANALTQDMLSSGSNLSPKQKAPLPKFRKLGTKELKFTSLPSELEEKLIASRQRVQDQKQVVRETTSKHFKQKKLWK